MKEISQALEERLLQLLSEKQMKEQTLAFIEEMYSFLEDWRLLRDNLAVFAGQNGGDENVVWVEGDLRALPNSLVIYCQPVHAGETLQKAFFAKKSVVLTSATLTVGGSFRYFLGETGLSHTTKTVAFRRLSALTGRCSLLSRTTFLISDPPVWKTLRKKWQVICLPLRRPQRAG